MIMKRKLPSQTEKLDEDLLEKEKNQKAQAQEPDQNTPSTGDTASSGASDEASQQDKQTAAPSSEGGEADKTTQDAPQSDVSQSDISHPNTPPASSADTSTTPDSQPDDSENEESFDPFVHGSDDDDMTRAAPPQRPQHDFTEGAPTHPRKHQVSTQALLGGGDTQEKTPDSSFDIDTSPAANKARQEAPSTEDFSAPDLSDPGLADPSEPKQENAATATPPPQDGISQGDSAQDDTSEDDSDDTWDLGDLVNIPEDASNIGTTPFSQETDAPDIDPDQEEVAPPPGADPPWKRKTANSSGNTSSTSKKDGGKTKFTPKLPKTAQVASSKMGAITSLLLMALLIGGTTLLYQNRDVAVEVISRWTGTLNEVGQPVPEEVAPQASQEPPNGGTQRAENTSTFQPANETNNRGTRQESARQDTQDNGNINLKVLNERKDKADEPIVGDENVDMPEDIDKFSSLQRAIAEKRAERQKGASAKLPDEEEAVDPNSLSPEEITRRNAKIIRQTNQTLAEYRQALADVDDPALKPRPGRFLEGKRTGNKGQLPPPEQNASKQQQKPQLYGNKVVSNLSALIEEKTQKENNVRMLEDFDVALFNPRRKEVSIPKGITPRLTKESFPPLEVLSFVPDHGVIAKAGDTEGVLLLGETLEGWELIEVKSDYAEFQKNGKKRIVTFNNANR